MMNIEYRRIIKNQYPVKGRVSASGSYEPTARRGIGDLINPGERNRGIYIRGTSNSAALASRGAALIYEVLDELRSGADTDIHDEYMAVVIKSLLVHGASWGNSINILENCLKATGTGWSCTRARIEQARAVGQPFVN